MIRRSAPPSDVTVAALLESLSRNFDDGLRIHAELTRRNIGIVAIRENIDTREGSAVAKFFRRSMLGQGAYQVDSASERIRLGLDRVRASGKRVGRPPALSHEPLVTTKTLGRRFFSIAGRLTRAARRLTLHLPQRWPWEAQFSRALARLQAIPHPV